MRQKEWINEVPMVCHVVLRNPMPDSFDTWNLVQVQCMGPTVLNVNIMRLIWWSGVHTDNTDNGESLTACLCFLGIRSKKGSSLWESVFSAVRPEVIYLEQSVSWWPRKEGKGTVYRVGESGVRQLPGLQRLRWLRNCVIYSVVKCKTEGSPERLGCTWL
jgi:hypothetical protein